jgi:hypothetical protein
MKRRSIWKPFLNRLQPVLWNRFETCKIPNMRSRNYSNWLINIEILSKLDFLFCDVIFVHSSDAVFSNLTKKTSKKIFVDNLNEKYKKIQKVIYLRLANKYIKIFKGYEEKGNHACSGSGPFDMTKRIYWPAIGIDSNTPDLEWALLTNLWTNKPKQLTWKWDFPFQPL